ncbi:hypothetical protein BDQ17DRAFT_1364988 [Cyathus striatus]|nr:hypothetical protein BDQ17DRAFT_1364988 [Cyathus striatus]
MTIEELLDHTYGPYPDYIILSETWRPGGPVAPTLTSVYMTTVNDNTPIGLSEVDCWVGAAPAHQEPVRFFGRLAIESLNWLTDTGKYLLLKDIRAKDDQIHVLTSASKITLEDIYGNPLPGTRHFKIHIFVSCIKILRAQFLTSETHPYDLILVSEDQQRKYSIKSMHVQTFHRSLDFLTRWHIWSLIEEIVKSDEDQTVLHDRTLDWLVQQYRSHSILWDQDHKIIFDSDDSESEDLDIIPRTKSKHPQTIRHIPRNEIIGRIAEHAEWLLAYQLAPLHRNLWRLNIIQFIQFCMALPTRRKQARLSGADFWGVPMGDRDNYDLYENEDLCERLCLFGETYAFWSSKIKHVYERQNMDESTSPSNLDEDLDALAYFYDSDFSEASTSSASDDSEDRDKLLVKLEQNKIPSFCFYEPKIPIGEFVWRCPGPGCEEKIDLLHLKPNQLNSLPPKIAQNLARKLWKSVNDQEVQLGFFILADQHYKWHIKQEN